ncbi:3-hydroxyacyl-CoA dehydrogenase NAD-binding domain-containing protein [Pararhodobacter zhoushanensis]|uniref:enoyl-CoA hydratase n=1 Tax=Pararhodobacter zhoushanensis TaxID=2479545 RepID=A0ABT3H1K8_9RHOB|nr:3-hydroxyacyl-CoA dehydrogenase NAD-binding domain-containing protein [Pararhodobacter zhoushanensis]MCW1933679.1 3-hydroxyacyl-CoA dehydrogenase NAD-binding domain-containing protein [Pararhodobacter zhoushanensis]
MTGPVLQHLGTTKLELGPVGPGDGPWRRGEADGIVWLVLDRADAAVNTVDRSVMTGLTAELDTLERTPPRAVVIRSGKLAGFAAGADITDFDAMSADGAADLLHQGHDVLDRLAALKCPTVCVVHGAALGAGFEIALACDWRIAVDGASFGFPEVQLGLHPGLGGTFRLPALIDPTEAMTLMLTGKTAHTAKAKALGIADIVTQERHVRAAVDAIVAGDVERGQPGLKARAFGLDAARSLAARQMRSETEKKAPKHHYPAPHALIDLWEKHGDDPKALQAAEIDSFAALLETDTSRNLRRVFFLRQGLKEGARDDDAIAHVHVIGGGAMGAEIAAWAAIKGKSVTLGDVQLDPLGRAIKQARETCKGQHLSGIETRDALDRLMPDPRGYGIARADLVIEAVPESPELKARIYADLAGRMKPGAILASNTSSLRLRDLQASAPDAARFAGLHFFNPVSKMQLVEVVRHDGTDPAVVQRLAAFCGSLDRLPVLVTDYPGFLVNRALTPYLMEAMVLMEEGVAKETIDAAAMDFGMPMGPVALSDQVGLDICLHVAESLKDTLDKPMPEISRRLRDKVEAGNLGKKTGQGFYDWSKGTPRPQAAGETPEDLIDRLILPMLDACVECLRKGVARGADDVDGAMIFATGFAPFRGGPLHYARARGVAGIEQRLTDLAERHGARFAPDPGWKDL